MIKKLIGYATLASLSAIASSASAEDTFDPLSEKAVLAAAKSDVLTSGKAVLSQVGTGLLGVATNAMYPGLGTLLGMLENHNDRTQEVLDAINAEGARTRAVIVDLWNWNRQAATIDIAANYAALEVRINSWIHSDEKYLNGQIVRDRRLLVGSVPLAEVNGIVTQLKAIMRAYQTGMMALERINNLQGYIGLLGLAIPLATEYAELDCIGAKWELDGGGDFDIWWNNKTEAERNVILSEIQQRRRFAAESLLGTTTTIGLESYLANLESQFVAAQDQMFSEIHAVPGTSDMAGRPTYYYYMGNDPSGWCLSGDQYCKKYTITGGTASCTQPSGSGGLRYFADFDTGGRTCYTDQVAVWNDHRAQVLRDLITRVYGPVRAFAEKWLDAWELGPHGRSVLDTRIDEYLYAKQDSARDLDRLKYGYTIDLSAGEEGFLYGFGLSWGLGAVKSIGNACQRNSNFLAEADAHRYLPYMADPNAYVISTLFPAWLQMSVMRSWPKTDQELDDIYAGFVTASLGNAQASTL